MPRQPRSALILVMVLMLCCPAAWSVGAGSVPDSAASVKQTSKPDSPSGSKAGPQRDFLAELEAGDKKQSVDSEEPSMIVTALAFVSRLALVIGLAYLTILGLKRVSNMKPGIQPGKRSMRVVENLTLGANRQLHLVEAGSRTLVIASTPSRVSLIAELDADEVTTSTQTENAAGFGEQLKMFMGAKSDASEAAGSVAQVLRDSGAFLRGKAVELGGLRKRMRTDQDD